MEYYYEKLQDQTCARICIDVMDYEFNSPNIKVYIVRYQQSIIPFEGMVIPFPFSRFPTLLCFDHAHAIGIPDQYIMARGGWKNRYCSKGCIQKM